MGPYSSLPRIPLCRFRLIFRGDPLGRRGPPPPTAIRARRHPRLPLEHASKLHISGEAGQLRHFGDGQLRLRQQPLRMG